MEMEETRKHLAAQLASPEIRDVLVSGRRLKRIAIAQCLARPQTNWRRRMAGRALTLRPSGSMGAIRTSSLRTTTAGELASGHSRLRALS